MGLSWGSIRVGGGLLLGYWGLGLRILFRALSLGCLLRSLGLGACLYLESLLGEMHAAEGLYERFTLKNEVAVPREVGDGVLSYLSVEDGLEWREQSDHEGDISERK